MLEGSWRHAKLSCGRVQGVEVDAFDERTFGEQSRQFCHAEQCGCMKAFNDNDNLVDKAFGSTEGFGVVFPSLNGVSEVDFDSCAVFEEERGCDDLTESWMHVDHMRDEIHVYNRLWLFLKDASVGVHPLILL
jgi:hypothetical protein